MTEGMRELQPTWITDAPNNFTVADAEADESRGMSWPISGDATTIYQNTPPRFSDS